VQFTDTTLNSPTSWSWNFGDPASASNTSTLRNPAHVYASAGVFTIRLTAANAAGSSSTTNTVTVTAPTILPAASFGAAYKGTLLTEQFTDTSTGSPTSWAWSFGDTASGAANASTAKNPSHTFSKVGAYTVKLTVRNAAGSSSASHSLNVYMYRLVVSSTAAPQPIVTSRN
jgi:PKD repeat protein